MSYSTYIRQNQFYQGVVFPKFNRRSILMQGSVNAMGKTDSIGFRCIPSIGLTKRMKHVLFSLYKAKSVLPGCSFPKIQPPFNFDAGISERNGQDGFNRFQMHSEYWAN